MSRWVLVVQETIVDNNEIIIKLGNKSGDR